MAEKRLAFQKNFLSKYRCAALLALLIIASCSPGPTGSEDPSSNSPSGGNGSSNKQIDSTKVGGISKDRKSKDGVLDINLFVVENESSQALGNVTITNLLDSQSLVVGSGQADTTAIPFAASLVVLNLQVCFYPDTTIVNLSNGAQVAVGWKNPNLITVIDYDTQD